MSILAVHWSSCLYLLNLLLNHMDHIWPYCILHFQMLLWRFVALTWSWVPRQGDRVPYRLCAHPIPSPPKTAWRFLPIVLICSDSFWPAETSCGIQHHRLSERHDTLTLKGFQARSRHYHCIPRGDLDPVKWNRGISASLVSWNDVNLCQILEKSWANAANVPKF